MKCTTCQLREKITNNALDHLHQAMLCLVDIHGAAYTSDSKLLSSPLMILSKMSFGSQRICLAGSKNIEAIALFHYKLFWYPTLLGLFIAKICTFTLRLLIETFDFIENSGKCPLFLDYLVGFSKSPCNKIQDDINTGILTCLLCHGFCLVKTANCSSTDS